MPGLSEAWIEEGRASLLPITMTAEFEGELLSMPWVVSTLDWARLKPTAPLNRARATGEQVLQWAKRTAIGACTHMALRFNAKKPCLLVSVEDGLRYLDELFEESPGVRFCFGVDVADGKVRPHYDAVLQYGTGHLLVASALPA